MSGHSRPNESLTRSLLVKLRPLSCKWYPTPPHIINVYIGGVFALQRPKSKKPGQQYIKKELLDRGWTVELIESHLTRRQKGSKLYYRATEVAEQEANP